MDKYRLRRYYNGDWFNYISEPIIDYAPEDDVAVFWRSYVVYPQPE